MDPKESIRTLGSRFSGGDAGNGDASGCFTDEQLLEAAREGVQPGNDHWVGCGSCREIYKKFREEVASGAGLQSFLRVARAQAEVYEKGQGSRWVSRVVSYFVVSRNGRIATAAMASCVLLLAGMVVWDRTVPPVRPAVAVFEPEVYTQAITELGGLVSDMNGNRVKAEEVRSRVNRVNPLLEQAQSQPLRGEQRAEIFNLYCEYEAAKTRYSVSAVPNVYAVDSVAGLIKSLRADASPTDLEQPRQWELVSVSLKQNKESAETIVLQSGTLGPVTMSDPAIKKMASYANREATNISWKDVAWFAPGQPVKLLRAGLTQ